MDSTCDEFFELKKTFHYSIYLSNSCQVSLLVMLLLTSQSMISLLSKSKTVLRNSTIANSLLFHLVRSQNSGSGDGSRDVIEIFILVGCCILVSESESDPFFTNCEISDCEHDGIVFVNRSAGTMIDCSIFNNRLAGITCTSKSKPVFRSCQIYNGRDVGVLLLDRSEAYFKNCQIYSNKLAGIEIKNGANPTVTNSVIRDGETGGIYFNTKGNGFFR